MAFAAAASAVTTMAAFLWSCASVPLDTRVTNVDLPNQTVFVDNVSYFLERRCGTLDCHGQPGRPLRLYGQFGLRLPSAEGGTTNTPGGLATTPAEKVANYRAVVGLEPEQLNRVMAGESVRTLLLFQKPLGFGDGELQPFGVRHRGGPQLLGERDPGYECMEEWLRDNFTAASSAKCLEAGNGLDGVSGGN